jgi:hypothetical protein
MRSVLATLSLLLLAGAAQAESAAWAATVSAVRAEVSSSSGARRPSGDAAQPSRSSVSVPVDEPAADGGAPGLQFTRTVKGDVSEYRVLAARPQAGDTRPLVSMAYRTSG